MTDNLDFPEDCLAGGTDDNATSPQLLPIWRASFRMALVSAVSLLAVGMIATGMSGCADVSNLAPNFW